mmetsp:Transcript_8138/g.20376  ORF Transcript_8138/g.20376 Transcript_8138/m.20376 type:complete len:250 (-) Transcript_8138:515-1264(-)
MGELALPFNKYVHQRQLPVLERGLSSVLHLPQGLDGGLHHRAFAFARAEFVVEDGLPDDVQRARTKSLLHVNNPIRFRGIVQLRRQHLRSPPEFTDLEVQPLPVETRHDRPPTDLPRLKVSGDQPFPHDILQHLSQHAFVVVEHIVPQHVPNDLGIGHHHEALRAETQLVYVPKVFLILLQTQVHRAVGEPCARKVSGRQGSAIVRWLAAEDLFDVSPEDVHRVPQRQRRAWLTPSREGQCPERLPPPW